jgi:hypothetical protein
MSSANVFIFTTYSTADEGPFCVVANAIRVLITRAQEREAKAESMCRQTLAAVGKAVT